jgi:hypothetical protein
LVIGLKEDYPDKKFFTIKIHNHGQWLIPVIRAAQEAKIRRILVQSQPG